MPGSVDILVLLNLVAPVRAIILDTVIVVSWLTVCSCLFGSWPTNVHLNRCLLVVCLGAGPLE
jgi:hypothetical protein